MNRSSNPLKNCQLTTKTTLIFVANCFFVASVFGQRANNSDVFTIEGKIENFGNGSLVGTIIDPKNNYFRTDTIIVKNNLFRHIGHIRKKQIVSYTAIGDKFAKYRKVVKDGDTVMVDFSEEKSRSIEIVVSPGSKIKVQGVAKTYLDAYPSGTEENVQIASLNQKIYPLLDQLGSLDYTNKKTIRSVLKIEETLLTSISDLEFEFIKRHPSSIIASYIIWKKYEIMNKRDPVKADSLYSLIHPIKKNLYQQQILLLQRNRAKKSMEVSIGDTFPTFKTKFVYKDSNFKLNQTRGKYTLIDFWGSWCIPCVREMPKLKEYYEKFQNQLNIVSVAKDQYQNWKAFLDKNKYEWIQVLDQDEPKLSDMLHVEVYPTKYLLDPSGKVILITKNANDEIWKKLDRLFSPGN